MLPKRAALPLLALPLVGLAAVVAAVSLSAACVTSGDVSPVDGGFLPDGAPAPPPGDDGSIATFACVFSELDTFNCTGVTLPPPVWVGKCVDEDNCKSRVNGTSTSAGCAETIAYQDVQPVQMSCAAWQKGGGTLPVVDSGPPPVCAPGSVTSFKPAWHPPRAKTTACTQAQIQSYLACLDAAATTLNPAACTEWSGTISTTDQTCLTCLSSNETDAQYGPLVLLPTELMINVPGCIALAEGKTDGSGCGGALQADEQCQNAACLPTCPTSSAAQLTAEGTCEQEANAVAADAGTGGVCASYATPAECAGAIQAGDAGTAAEVQCFGAAGGGTNAEFVAVSLAFCGP